MAAKKRTDAELWAAIEKSRDDDEMERILALNDADLDAEVAEAGFDPAKLRADGEAFVTKLMADQDARRARGETDWQADAAAKLAAARGRHEARAAIPRPKLTGDELRARIQIARTNPRFAEPMRVLFRKTKLDEATDAELEALLIEMEALAEPEKE